VWSRGAEKMKPSNLLHRSYACSIGANDRNKYFNTEGSRMSVTAHRSTNFTTTHSHRSLLPFPKSK
jgi:hypothetical protein